MKRVISAILFSSILISGSVCLAQSNYPALINWKYAEAISIYDKPDGIVFCQMKNDSIHEDFLMLNILNQTDRYFYVSIYNRKDSKRGWIRKADYIGAYIKNETFPMELTLYRNKEATGINNIVIKKWEPDFITIEKVEGAWTYVSVTHDKMLLFGWIETNKLCANSYSTCN